MNITANLPAGTVTAKTISLPLKVNLAPADAKARSHAIALLGKLLPHLEQIRDAAGEIVDKREQKQFRGNGEENLQRIKLAADGFRLATAEFNESCFTIEGGIIVQMANDETPAKLRAHEVINCSLAGMMFIIVGYASMVPELPENLLALYKSSLEQLSDFLSEAEGPKIRAGFKSQPML